MKKITDIKSRAFKTFIQSFLGVLVPEVVIFLEDITIAGLTLSSLWYLAVPLICSALAAGISAAWNLISNYLNEDK